MSPRSHVIASAATGLACGYFTQSWSSGISCFLGGILIDLDHLLDYCFHYKRMCWRFSVLKDYCVNERSGKMYMIFHTYEGLIILWCAAYFLKANLIWVSFLFGLSVHLLLDQLINDVYPMAYFLFYRARFGFTKKIFHNEEFRRDFKK